MGQILLNVMQGNEPLYALADISRVQIIDQINVNWQIFQGSQIIKICCFGFSLIDKDRARQIKADDDDDIISITDSEMSELSWARTVTQDQVVTPATSKECLIQTPTIKIRLILLQFYIIFVFRQKFPT